MLMPSIYYDLIAGIKQKPDLPHWRVALNNKWSAATRYSGLSLVYNEEHDSRRGLQVEVYFEDI